MGGLYFLASGASLRFAFGDFKPISNQAVEKDIRLPMVFLPTLLGTSPRIPFPGMDPSGPKVRTICGQHNKLNHIE